MREALAQPLAIDITARRGERAHLRDIGRQRHRRRAGVPVDREVLLGAVASEVGRRVAIAGACRSVAAAHLDQPLDAEALDDRLEDRERQTQPLGEHQAGQLAAVQRLDQKLFDLSVVSPVSSSVVGTGGAVVRTSSSEGAVSRCCVSLLLRHREEDLRRT